MARDQKTEDVLCALIDKANKLIRRYTQERFANAGLRLTIDQWLTLQVISERPGISQIEIAELLFKDRASVTRILELMQSRKLVKKAEGNDKRSYQLTLTAQGEKYYKVGLPEVRQARKKGLRGLNERDHASLKNLLGKIVTDLE